MVTDEPCEQDGSREGSLITTVTITASPLSAPSVMRLSGLSAWCGAWYMVSATPSSASCADHTRKD